MKIDRWKGSPDQDTTLTQALIDQEAKRVLRRLCEPGAVMAVARDIETAVIVRETPQGEQLRTAVVDREIAQAMALKDWIECSEPDGQIVRYFVTNLGRASLRRLTAQDENAASGFAEARMPLAPSDAWDIPAIEGDTGRSWYQAFESPFIGLSRRRDRDGKPFLDRDLVSAGECLREDYELAKMGSILAAELDQFLQSKPGGNVAKASADALARVQDALRTLSPGLGDVAYRCCCLLRGWKALKKQWVGRHDRARLYFGSRYNGLAVTMPNWANPAK